MFKKLGNGLYESALKECAKLTEEKKVLKKEITDLKEEIDNCYSEISKKENVISETYKTHFRLSDKERTFLLDFIEVVKRLGNDSEMFDIIADKIN